MLVKVYNQSGEETGTMELPDGVFGLRWNADLVHQVVVSQRANMRPRVAHVKDRSEVRGGGRKPWRQKGTGRARHGSNRSPIWRGGGVTHGPRAEAQLKKKINKKMGKKALYTVLSAKMREQQIIVVDNLAMPEAKTKHAAGFLQRLARRDAFSLLTRGRGVLVACEKKDAAVYRAFRNIPYAKIDEARNLQAHEVLQYRYVLFPRVAVAAIR